MEPLRKIKFVLGFNFTILFVFILSIPFFIKNETRWASEEFTEAFFIAIGLIALIYLFRHYNYLMTKKEEEAILLDVKLKSKEKELLDAFQYLGKVNVQFSMIKDLLRKTEMPTTKNELKRAFGEVLSLACSITKSHFAVLKIIDLENQRILHESFCRFKKDENEETLNIGNGEILENMKKNNSFVINGISVFTSRSENFNIKAFICVPEKEIDKKEEKDFLEAIANQCEIIFLLFNSKYYKK